VWNGFLAAREKNPELKLYACFDDKHSVCICSSIDGTQTKPIDQNEKLDITVFDMESFQEFLGEQGKNFFYPLTIPVSQLTTNDLVGIIGSPGKQRFETEKGTGFGRQPYFAYVSATSGFTIRVDFTRVMSLDRELTYKQGDKKPAIAGVSGGPCFLINTDYKSYLIGVVTDHVCYEDREDNYLTVTTANCINEDGTLPACLALFHRRFRRFRRHWAILQAGFRTFQHPFAMFASCFVMFQNPFEMRQSAFETCRKRVRMSQNGSRRHVALARGMLDNRL
jgi:hypothetical protein